MKITLNAAPIHSERARKIQEAFGIVNNMIQIELIKSLDLSIKKGEIILIGGASGTGKSILLSTLEAIINKNKNIENLNKEICLEYKLKLKNTTVASIKKIKSNKSPIDFLRNILEESLKYLSSSGLVEPQLFVRQSNHLSVGQSYRLSIAYGLSQKTDILLIDEFCECLDKFSTYSICKRLRSIAEKKGTSFIAATATVEKVMNVLKPDKTILIASDGQLELINFQIDELHYH